MTDLSTMTQAVLLLTSYFGKPQKDDPKPLTPVEWGRFAYLLKKSDLVPSDLLTERRNDILKSISDKGFLIDRIGFLLDRGASMALAVEKWQRSGIWIIDRSSDEYPLWLKKRLDKASPPILFGCGDKSILKNTGIAVIGSRNSAAKDLAFSEAFGKKVANSGLNIVSGGARGIDESAMFGALKSDGTAIGVLANGLLQASISQKYRSFIRNRNLLLVSTYYPEAGFSVGNAMGRNKYIYCLSNAAVAVHSGKKGGTWSGAVENIKKQWVPLWVYRSSDKESGNKNLVDKGANWVPENILEKEEISFLMDDKYKDSNHDKDSKNDKEIIQGELF